MDGWTDGALPIAPQHREPRRDDLATDLIWLYHQPETEPLTNEEPLQEGLDLKGNVLGVWVGGEQTVGGNRTGVRCDTSELGEAPNR